VSAREQILERIRRGLGRGAGGSRAAQEQLTTYLRRHPRGPLPEISEDLVARFHTRAQALASSCEKVAGWDRVAESVGRYLESQRLPRRGCVWPALAGIDWKRAGLEFEARAAHGGDLVGVTGAFCAIAETGSLMMASGADTPASVSLLPETHIAVVPVARVVAHMEDGWDLARTEWGELPRAVNFISGPSRTADIEQTVVLGAHGPYRVHIVLVG